MLTECSQSASEDSNQPLQQEDKETKEEDKCSFMDFHVREVAEQLTRLDAVSLVLFYVPLLLVLRWLLHLCCISLRSCLLKWCPSTAWAVSGRSVTRRIAETWRPPSAPPSPSSTLSPTGSSPPSFVRCLPVLPLLLLSHHPARPLPFCTPPLPRTRLILLTPAPPTERAS